MPRVKANRSGRVMPPDELARRAAVLARVRAFGFPSIHKACIDKKVDAALIHAALRRGLARNPHENTVKALDRLGVLDLFRHDV